MSVRTKEKKAAAPVDTLKKRSQLFEIWDRLRTNKLAMVGMGIVIVLILLAAAAAAAYVLGYGYPLQEKVAQDFLNATVSEQSTDAYWNSSVTQESRDAQMAALKDVSTYEVIAVERNTSNSLVYVKTALKDGGTAYYQLMMGRDLIGWDVEYVELYFPSEH